MKIKLIIAHCLTAFLFLTNCKENDKITVIHTVNEADYPIVDTLAAANIEFAGHRLNVQEFGDFIWFTKTDRMPYHWVNKNYGHINFISYTAKLMRETWIDGKWHLQEIRLVLPNIYNKTLDSIPTFHNYPAFVASFKKGRYDLAHPFPSFAFSPQGKYQISIINNEQNSPQTKYAYSSVTQQEGSVFELLSVKEVGFNQVLVKFKVNCQLTANQEANVGRLKGVMQFRIQYQDL